MNDHMYWSVFGAAIFLITLDCAWLIFKEFRCRSSMQPLDSAMVALLVPMAAVIMKTVMAYEARAFVTEAQRSYSLTIPDQTNPFYGMLKAWNARIEERHGQIAEWTERWSGESQTALSALPATVIMDEYVEPAAAILRALQADDESQPRMPVAVRRAIDNWLKEYDRYNSHGSHS